MKAARVFVLSTLVLVGAVGQSPVGKVIELLSNLEAHIQKEGEESAKLNSEKEGWCKDTATQLGFEIKTGSSEVDKLKAAIGKEAASITSLASKVEDLAATIAKNDKDLAAATKIRGEEESDFVAEEKELSETISALQRAIGILQREMAKSGGAAFVQVQTAGSVIQALQALVKASAFSSEDAATLTAFVQSSQEAADGDSVPGAPEAAAYDSKSGGIVDVLEDLLDKANSQLAAARKKEETAMHNFAMLKQSLTDEIKFSSKDMDEAKKSSAASGEAKSQAEGALAATSKDLGEDKSSLAEVQKDCATYADDYAAEVTSRAEELKAVQAAKKVLAETTGGATGVAYGLDQVSTPSFLQLHRSRSAISSGADLANVEAVRFVRELGRKFRSPALAQLAKRMMSAMRFSAASGEDPFSKVKGLISDMIAKLEGEAGQDAQHKEYCDTEMGDTNTKKDEKTTVVEKLTTKINQMSAESAALKDSTATLQKELAELAASQAEMDKMRKAENELFLTSKKELTEGISGVQLALKTLREYYNEEAKDHEASSGAGTSIIGLLEVCLSDFTKSLAEISAGEDSAASEYEATTQENKIEKVAKDQDVKYQVKEAASLDKAVVEATADRATTQEELDAALEYLAKLKDMCVAKPETYAERAERRTAEIAGLKQALSILDGEAMLLQRRALRGH
jgi:predicted  nucleic acid-binding Zn-ribbon protein